MKNNTDFCGAEGIDFETKVTIAFDDHCRNFSQRMSDCIQNRQELGIEGQEVILALVQDLVESFNPKLENATDTDLSDDEMYSPGSRKHTN